MQSKPAKSSYEYAIVRVVPKVEREEFVNAGVIVFSRVLKFLDARIELDEARLLAVAPDVDLAEVREHLRSIPLICAGGTAAGPIGALPMHERYQWLVAPRSTIIQTSPSHSGLCEVPSEVLDRLFEKLVKP